MDIPPVPNYISRVDMETFDFLEEKRYSLFKDCHELQKKGEGTIDKLVRKVVIVYGILGARVILQPGLSYVNAWLMIFVLSGLLLLFSIAVRELWSMRGAIDHLGERARYLEDIIINFKERVDGITETREMEVVHVHVTGTAAFNKRLCEIVEPLENLNIMKYMWESLGITIILSVIMVVGLCFLDCYGVHLIAYLFSLPGLNTPNLEPR